jgi:hypothetical protein
MSEPPRKVLPDYGREEHSGMDSYLGILLLTALALSVLSAIVLWRGAVEEPYFGEISVHQGLLQVGGSSLLIFCWCIWMGVILWLVRQRRLNALWALTLLWALVLSYYLFTGAVGYLEDLKDYQRRLGPVAPTGPVF